jgi:ubiquinone/menaquinone biosynthesis C-methylase UbiE
VKNINLGSWLGKKMRKNKIESTKPENELIPVDLFRAPVTSSGTNWQRLIGNMEKGEETRFTIDWYRHHPITHQLLQADIQWGKTLELASGIGVRALLLRQYKNCPVTGIDIDDFAVEYSNKIALEKFGFNQDEANFSKGSFYEIPFPESSFENVILIAGLEHAFYPVKVLDEIHRVIRDGGKLFLSITENNFHADPDHKSSWNEVSVRRLLSSYGNVITWVYDKITFAILEFQKRLDEPKVVLCDLNIKDSYTPYWIDAFNRYAKCDVVNIKQKDSYFASPEITETIIQASKNANMLFFGTGAAFTKMSDLCMKIKQIYPHIVISKWFGDPTDFSIKEDRFVTEVINPSIYFDQVFMIDTKRLGQVASSCGQFFLNGLYDPSAIYTSIPWQDRPIDVLCIANAYSQERLDNIKSFLPKGNIKYLWVGDGSFHGRMPRQLTNKLYGFAKIVINIVDSRHRKTQHWISNRAYWAIASGALVFSSPIEGLEDLFNGGILILDDDPLAWQRAYEEWLNPKYHDKIDLIVKTNQEQLEEFHTFQYKVYSILRHAGFAVSIPKDNVKSITTNNDQLQESRIVIDLLENEYILRQPISSLSAFKKMELGCGKTKSEGFIGVDRFTFPGVNVIADMNHQFPFMSDSIDLIYTSHSLEHVSDLPFTMSEIYRVCKHGAQVCIVAPYYNQSLNLANPYHKQVFNEHTPRFWTNYNDVPIEKAEYDHAASFLWGLAESDNSTAQIDLRILRMEFFYYPEYRYRSSEEQRLARKKYIDVCDQIMYNILVVKKNIEDLEMTNLTQELNLYEPPYVTIRKLREETEKQLIIHQLSLSAIQEQLGVTERELTASREQLGVTERELTASREQLGVTERELTASREQLGVTERELTNIQANTALLQENLDHLKTRSLKAVTELDRMRRNRIYRWVSRFRRLDLLPILNPAFQQYLDDSYLFQRVKGLRLQPSINLQTVPFLGYRLEFNRPGLCGIWIAPLLDIPLQQGVVGIEIVSPVNKILLQQVVSVSALKVDMPEHFVFTPIAGTQNGIWEIRIFTREVEGPVRLFEWRKYSWGGLGRLKRCAFLGFDYSESP